MMSSLSWKTALAGIAITIGAGFAVAHAAMPPFMHDMGPGTMNGTGPRMMGMAHDSETMAQLGVIHELFINHDRIKRTVTNLTDGIRTTTESDDARIAQLLKEHVADMRQRVDAGNDPGLPIESDALHLIFRNYDKVQTEVEMTDKGIVVIQTSTDSETIAALQQHASEVSDFVTQGMVAMRAAMMKKMGGRMPAGMHRGMSRMPNHGGATQVR